MNKELLFKAKDCIDELLVLCDTEKDVCDLSNGIIDYLSPWGKLTGSEAIFGFMGWLTSRNKILKIGATEDAAPVVPLIGKFMKANNLPEPGERWIDKLQRIEE